MASQGDWSAGEQPVVIYGMGKKGVNSPLAQPFINYNFPRGLIPQLRVRDLLVTPTKDLSYINPGPFDVLAWQLLWVGGLFCGQRLYEKKRALPLPMPLSIILIVLSIAFRCKPKNADQSNRPRR